MIFEALTFEDQHKVCFEKFVLSESKTIKL